MTILRKVRAYNCCQHRDVALDVGPGLVVLTGAMGSGKTNLLELIFSSLGNDFKAFYGVKKLNIRHGAEKQPAYIQTDWETGSGDEFEVIRYLQKGDSVLFVNGQDTELRGEADITRKIELLLGYDVKLLRENCFVSQSKTSAIVEQEDTDRAKFWANLLGATWLLKLQAPITAELERVSGLISHDWQNEIDEITRDIERILNENAEINKVIAQWQPRLLTDDAANEARLSLDKTQSIDQQRKNKNYSLQRLSSLQDSLAAVKNTVDPLQSKLQKANAKLQLCRRQASAVKHNLHVDDTRSELQQAIKAKPVFTAKPPLEPAEAELPPAELDLVRSTVVSLSKHVSTFRKGKPVCDECQQPIDLNPKKGAEYVQRLAEAKRQLQSLEDIQSAWVKYRQQLSNYDLGKKAHDLAMKRWEDNVTRLRKKVAELGDRQDTDPSLPSESDLMQEITKLERQIKQATANGSEASIREAIAGVEGELKTIDAYLAQNPISGLSTALQMQLTQHEEAHATITSHQSALDRNEGSLLSLRSRLLSAQQKQMGQRPLIERKAALEAAKKLLRPAELPSQVLSAAAENLILKANTICEQLDLPFQLYMSDEFDLMVTHSDGRDEPVRRLSHGQRACVSVALWVAKLAACDTGLDVLVLDEPSANMDATGVRMFAEMLLSLGEFLQATKLQVWLTTHHQQLAGCGQYHLHLGT